MKYQSDKTDIVCQAIEDARQEFLPLEKSGVNNFFKNRKGEPHLYSTLDNILYIKLEYQKQILVLRIY